MDKLNIAIIGQGRSGKDIHGAYFASDKNTTVNVKYVVDADERRRNISLERYPGCEVFSDYHDILDKKDIDLVVNCTYSYMHYPITLDLLEHKFNVLVEKPFARNAYECDVLINTAKKNGVVLAVFQQTFFAPYYRHVLDIIKSGVIGTVLQADVRFNGFSRRWDWQTLQKKMGGSAYNTGPHPFGVALGILGFDENTKIAYSKMTHTPLSSGDADDYCKVILEAPGKPVVDIEINSQDAYGIYNVKLMGTKGTFKCTTRQYEYKYICDGENPERPVVEEFLQDAEGNPLYCSEKLNFHEENGKYDGDAIDIGTKEFYENLYDVIKGKGELYVTPEMAKRVIGIIEEVHARNPMPVKNI